VKPMKKRLMLIALFLILVSVGCHGPQNVTRSLDDWTNQAYVTTPWLAGNPIAHVVFWIGDNVCWVIDSILNIYYFWSDAPPTGEGAGTPYYHKVPIVPGR
jgi:hypothetical protein